MTEITQIQVFVSCPSDVTPEKEVVQEVCERINKNLLQIGCSITLTVREWGEIFGQIGIQPQDSINAAFKDYDIYLGILWMRFGTPIKAINPQTNLPYQSGTEQEFEIALERWKKDSASVRINFFFKDPIAVTTIDENHQQLKVLEFKKRISQIGMTNRFTNTSNFKDQITDLLNQISFKLCLAKKNEIKKDLLTTEEITTPQKIVTKNISHLISNLSKDIKVIEHYIPRSVKSVKEINKRILLFQDEQYESLADVALRSNKIVILGNAGTGKSIELQQLAKNFSDFSNPFIPIYKKFNTYVNEDIQDFLPSVWKEIDHEILLLLFDGLDEIQPQNFNTAIRKIVNFSEQFPSIKLIISCRTNFYELPTDSFPGTLSTFDCYYLNDLSITEIKRYSQSYFGINGDELVQSAFDEGYIDIITKPFFLNILISYYKKFGNLRVKRSDIIREFILSRITLDKNHFSTTLEGKNSKVEIMRLLQLVAISMEMLGRNFILTDELLKVVGSDERLSLLKYYSAFNKINDTEEKWQFEHNNIQEYLAAGALANNAFEVIKQMISFPPSFNKIKPSWVNTLSFLISIVDNKKVEELVNWIISSEPEIIVKFEKDRITDHLRITLFKQIFGYYKEKEIWIRSNKFTDKELAIFSQSEEAIEYLLSELSDPNNSRIVKLNAVHIIDNFDFSIFQPIYLERAKNLLFDLLERENIDAGFIYQILGALAELKLNDRDSLNRIITKFGKRKNEYIRAGLYKVIGESEFVNEYVDVFLDGITLTNLDDETNERDEVHLADESWLLKEGLSKATTPEAITKILDFFANPTDRRIVNFYEAKEIFENVVNNSIAAYTIKPSIFEFAFKLFVMTGKMHDSQFAMPLVNFFDKTKTKRKAFSQLFHHTDIDSYEKGTLISALVDKDIIDYFIEEFLKRDYTNEDVNTFYKDLVWHHRIQKAEFNPTNYFEEQIEARTDVKLDKAPVIDYAAINQIKSQDNFDLLFDREKLLAEIKLVFQEVGTNDLNYHKLWETRRKNNQLLDEYYPEVVLSILRDFTQNKSAIEFQIIYDWVMSQSFEYYQIGAIHDILKSNSKIKVSEDQMKHIDQWAQKVSKRIDSSNIVRKTEATEESFSISQEAQILWYFIENLNIKLPNEILLKFTLFGDFSKGITDNSHGVLDHLCKIVGVTAVNNQVMLNLKSGIPVSWIWKSNALYAIDNNLNSTFPTIVENLIDDSKSQYQRIDVLAAYFTKTQNFGSLRRILEATQTSSIQFKIIELLSNHAEEKSYLITYLEKILVNDTQILATRLKAAGYLIALNNLNGLKFYTDYLLEDKQPLLDFHQLNFFSKLTTTDALPDLMKLLKLAKSPEEKYGRFNYLEQVVNSAIHNIGIYSVENLIKVTNELNLFMTTYRDEIPHINFIQFTIDRMEEQFYSSLSQSYSIDDALEQIKLASIINK